MAVLTAAGTSVQLLTDLGGTPSAGDSVYVGKGNLKYTDAAENDRSGTDLLLFELLPGWYGDFDEATPLKVVLNQTSTGILRLKWAGQRSYVRSTSMAAGVIYRIEQDPASGGAVHLSECDNEVYIQRAGVLHAASTADISKYYAGGFSVGHLYKSGPTVAECVAAGQAQVNLSRAATLVRALEQSVITITEEAIAPTHCYVDGGRVNHGGGNMTNLYLNGGILDLTRSPGPFTVTNRYAYQPTTILIKKGGLGEPTYTNKPIDYNPPRVVEV